MLYVEIVRLVESGDSAGARLLAGLDLRQMVFIGYHYWFKGDFGEHPIAASRNGS